MNDTKPKPPKPLPSMHLLGTGTPWCAGCGEVEAVREIYATWRKKRMAAEIP